MRTRRGYQLTRVAAPQVRVANLKIKKLKQFHKVASLLSNRIYVIQGHGVSKSGGSFPQEIQFPCSIQLHAGLTCRIAEEQDLKRERKLAIATDPYNDTPKCIFMHPFISHEFSLVFFFI